MDNLLGDVRYAARMLLRSPMAAVVSVIALALGIGVNVSCFTSVNAMVLHPLRYPGLEGIMTLWETVPKARADRDLVTPANFVDWKARSQAFERMAAFRRWDVTLTGTGDPERVQGCLASADLFPLLGLQPLLGRTFTSEETEPGRDDVVVVSQGFWRTRLGSAGDAVGKTIALGGRAYRVVGVMPSDFDFPLATDLWTPLAMTGEEKNQRATRDLAVLARVKPGVTVAQARAEMDGIAQRLAREYPKTNEERGVVVVSLRQLTNNVTDRFVLTLLGGASFVLLLACANVGNLQLSRAAARQKMIAVQAALGASRLRIARQLACESLLLSVAGGGLGLWLAAWDLELSRTTAIPPEVLQWVAGVQYMRVDGTVLWFTLAASLATGLLCSLPSAYHLLRHGASGSLVEVLKESGRGSTAGSSRSRLRSALVVFEVAMALILLVGAGLMVSTFRRMLTLSPGYDTKNLLTMQVALPALNYRDDAHVTAFYDNVLRNLAGIPEVKAAGGAAYLPAAEGLFVEGRPEPRPGEPIPSMQAVSDHYLQALGLPLLRGRLISAQDGVDSRRVVILSESVARHYWPGDAGADVVGRRIRLAGGQSPWLTVVGVVGDVRDWFTHNPVPKAYVPCVQAPRLSMELILRTSGDPLRVAGAARARIRNVDPRQPVYDVKSMEQLIAAQTSGVRVSAQFMSVYAAIALLLAVTGIYAVVAYSVVQRTHEIGIRMALGAGRVEVLKLTLGFSLRMAGLGLAIGVPAAFLLMRLVSRVLYDVVVVDSLTLAVFTVLLAATSLAAGYIPARHATQIDPLVALRED